MVGGRLWRIIVSSKTVNHVVAATGAAGQPSLFFPSDNGIERGIKFDITRCNKTQVSRGSAG